MDRPEGDNFFIFIIFEKRRKKKEKIHDFANTH